MENKKLVTMLLCAIGLALCVIGVLLFMNAQDTPKKSQKTNAPPAVPTKVPSIVEQKKPIKKNLPASPVFPTIGDYEQFPECRFHIYEIPNAAQSNVDIKEFFKELVWKIDSIISIVAFYDKNTAKFDTKQNAGANLNYNLISWDGFIPIKKAGEYTFLVTWPANPVCRGIGLLVNEKYRLEISDHDDIQLTLNVFMKLGMNKFRFIVGTGSSKELPQTAPMIRYKMLNAIGDFRELKPVNLYHKVENEDW